MIYFVLFQLIACTLFVWPGFTPDVFWWPKELMFLATGVLTLVLTIDSIQQRIVRPKALKAIALWTVISFLVLFFIPLLRTPMYWQTWSLMSSLNTLVGILLIYRLATTLRIEDWVLVAKCLCGLGSLVAGYGVLQYFGFDNFRYTLMHSNKIFTFFGNSFLTAGYLALTVPFFLMFEEKRYKAGLGLVLLALFLTQSASAIGASVLAICAYLWMSGKNKQLLAFIGVIAFMVWWYLPTHMGILTDGVRGRLWVEVLGAIKDNALFGCGLGSFKLHDWNATASKAMAAHNEYLQIWYEGGIILFGLVAYYLFDLVRRTFHSPGSKLAYGYLSSLVAFGGIAFFGFPLRIAPIALVGLLSIAALEANASST